MTYRNTVYTFPNRNPIAFLETDVQNHSVAAQK